MTGVSVYFVNMSMLIKKARISFCLLCRKASTNKMDAYKETMRLVLKSVQVKLRHILDVVYIAMYVKSIPMIRV